MRLLVALIMVMINYEKVFPISCKCVFELHNHQNNNNKTINALSCQSEINVTEIFPIHANNNLILGHFSNANITVQFLNSSNHSISLPSLFYLKIVDCVISNLSNVSFGGLENLRSLDLSRNKVKYLSNQKGVFNLTYLKVLDLSRNSLRMIESGPFTTLTSLEVLNLSANVIDTLTENAFSGLSKLQCLDISSNKLSTISSDVFVPLSTLQHLNLSNNLLQAIDEACLSSLQRLQQLDVSWNRLAHVAPGSLQLPSLSRLLLAGNPALGGSREPPLLVGPGKRLQTVDASRTGLKQVPAALTHSIRTLRLAGNSIKTVSCGHLDSYPLLQLLDFTSNELEEIEDDALGRLEVLSILYLSDNKLRSIPHNLPERLKILHLERNQIEQISPGDLQGMPLLEVLLLSDNKVKVVQEGAFSQLGALATLDLSQNPINVLPAGILSGPWQLQVLRLSNLNVISPAQDVSFPLSSPENLVTLDMANSPSLSQQFLADTAALMASKQLQELDLSDNGIERLRFDLLHFLPQLRILKLENNALNCTDLHWLAEWMRRQDQTESRKLTCFAPPEISGTLLIDLEEIESVTQSNYKAITPGRKTLGKPTLTIKQNSSLLFSKDAVEENKNFTIIKSTSKSEIIKESSQFPDGITASALPLSTTKSNVMSDDDLSNKQNFTHFSATLPTTYHSSYTTQQDASIKSRINAKSIKNETSGKLQNGMGDASSSIKYKKTAKLQNVNELNTFFPNKPQRENVETEMVQNLFVSSKKSSFNNENRVAVKHGDNNGNETLPVKDAFEEKNDSLELGENATERTGEMSMFREQNHKKDIIQVGMLMLLVGILGAVTTMTLIMCKFRKRRRSLRQQDIEVSSLPSVTELW